MDSNPDAGLARLHQLISAWPGLVSRPDPALVSDGLALIPHLAGVESLIDIGSGGGLPGLPLKIAIPGLRLVLLEANRRKAAFLVQAAAALELEGVEVVARRAEDAGRDPRLRDCFDAATARALAAMPALVELCLPFVRPGGRLLAMKADAPGLAAEVEAAQPAIEALAGRLLEVLPAASEARSLGRVVVIEKLAPTPAVYPRRAGVPERRPLGLNRLRSDL